MNRKMQRLLITTVVGLLFIVLAMTVIITINNNNAQRSILEESIKSNLISTSVAARELIDVELFYSYNSREDVEDNYNAYYNTLATLRTLNRLSGTDYIYALKLVDGKHYFVFDTDPFPYPDDPSRSDTIFDVYDEIAQVHLDAFDGVNSSGIMNVMDQWGTYNTGAVPIWRNGEVIGVIATDITDRYMQESREAATRSIFILIFTLSVVMGANIVIIRRFVISPISRLTESVSKDSIDANSVYGTYRDDEIGDLARKIQDTLGEAQSANRTKSDFLATMSHEIRTPMNAILGITEIQLQNDALDRSAKEGLEKIYTSGEMLLSIINDILDLSKIEAGKLELIIENYEVASLISDTAQLNMMRIGSKKIDFELQIDENLPVMLIGDELRIKQSLNNLLSNAFKYTNEGKVTFAVYTEEIKEDNPDDEVLIVFSVTDTGQGMSQEQVDTLFDDYSQFNTKANRETEGTGLGMGIAQNLIRMMRGVIDVKSEPGVGSTFSVSMPQGKVGTELLGKEMAANLHEFRTSSRELMKRMQINREIMPYGSVLIVDDVETNIFVAKGLMGSYELKMDSADSGFAAIDKVDSGIVYDIIFMDHMMPKMDGFEATRIIREKGYKEPIVALTANAVVGQAEVFLNNGFDDFISKPIDIRRLNSVLNRFIRDKQTPEVLEEARKLNEIKMQKMAEESLNKPDESGGPIVDPQILEVFMRDVKKSLDALTEIFDKDDPYNEKDMRTFVIHTHGLKSALANVGIMDLSNTAMNLEQWGRDENFEDIASETPGFLESLNELVHKLTPRDEPDSDETAEADVDEADMQLVNDKLMEIRAACEDYDETVAEAALLELKDIVLPRKYKELLTNIGEKLLHSDFDEIVEDIDNIMND
ncbi:MAG: response regulator [Oscillospiraceae bacterium]|jgi:signal transduction histidine kinase/DNA-binding response OmpR family regulator|nr:response regulator [Oscillospiraceae bacterium]